MTDLAVVTWLWHGKRADAYTLDHVFKMRSMVRRHLRIPHTFHCVTDYDVVRWVDDRPDGVRFHPIWGENIPSFKHCRRLKMFDPAVRELFADKILLLDLDLVIMADITAAIEHAWPLPLAYQAPNMSVTLFDAGYPPGLWETYAAAPSATLARAHAAGQSKTTSDQAILNWWCREKNVRRGTIPLKKVNHRALSGAPIPTGTQVVHFIGNGSQLNWDEPWLREHWA